MNRIFTILMLLLVLAGCSRDSTDKTIAQVQKYTVQICSFLPSVSTVANIISASNPAVTGSLAIARAICDAVTANPAGVQPALFIQIEDTKPPEQPCPMVNGVCIQGEFVKPSEEPTPNVPRETEPPPPGQDVPKEPLH